MITDFKSASVRQFIQKYGQLTYQIYSIVSRGLQLFLASFATAYNGGWLIDEDGLYCFIQGVRSSEHIDSDRSDQNSTFLIPFFKKVFCDVGCVKLTCFFFKYWMCQAQVFFKCQMCQSPSVYMPYSALSDSFTEEVLFIHCHYIISISHR